MMLELTVPWEYRSDETRKLTMFGHWLVNAGKVAGGQGASRLKLDAERGTRWLWLKKGEQWGN